MQIQIKIKKTTLPEENTTQTTSFHFFPPANPLSCFRVIVCSLKNNSMKKRSDLDVFNPSCIAQIIYRYCEEWRFNLFFSAPLAFKRETFTQTTHGEFMKTFRLGCIWVPLVLEQVVCLTPGPPEDVPEVRQTPHTSNHLSLCETEVSALWGVWNAVLRTKSKNLGNKCDICFRQVLGLNLLLLVVCVRLHVQN